MALSILTQMIKTVIPGEIYSLIDENGIDCGLCVFIESVEPWTIVYDGVEKQFWHWKVMHEGEIRYYNTNSWSLISPSGS